MYAVHEILQKNTPSVRLSATSIGSRPRQCTRRSNTAENVKVPISPEIGTFFDYR
jgi:hypothetical protein